MEKDRGISITSAVLSFDYDGMVLNLLDTPGHADFSEDTYRVLEAVDCAIMLLDSAKGLEPQTLKLFDVCRYRHVPVMTFVNKWDRPGREPLELLDEIEQRIGLRPTPLNWPVGIAGDFRGLIERATGEYTAYTRTPGGAGARHRGASGRRDGGRAGGRRVRDRRGGDWRCSMRSAPTSTWSRSWPGSPRRCCSARRCPTSVCAGCWTPCASWPRPRHRALTSRTSRARSTRRSPAWCSRSRPTWTATTGTGWRSSGSARGGSSAAWC